MNETHRVVIPLSGGMDSSFLMYNSVKKGYDTHPIILDDSYGKVGVRSKGIIPAINMVREAGLHHRLQVIPFFPTSTIKIADGKYGYTPGWNMAVALAALAYADFVDADRVWIGLTAEADQSFYPDTKQSMFDALAGLYNATYKKQIRIELPLIKMMRRDVITHGKGLNIPWELTISCVTTTVPMNCGVCPRCKERRQAFLAADVEDKTVYLKD